MNFIHRDINGIDLAIARLEKNYGDHYFIQQFCTEENWEKVKGVDWIRIINDAFSEAKRIGASVVDFRLIEKFDIHLVSEKLKSWGFSHIQDRIEYRSNLSELPTEEDSPIHWEAISSMEDSVLSEVVDLLKKVAHGDPNFDPNADNLAELKADLNDSTLSTGVDCVHIGYLHDEAIALVIAQVAPKTGWSRITYMGLDPKYRNKGLGKWVHRHGFTMLRNQRGLLYHGGTTSINLGMLRLFEEHGCRIYRRMQELRWGSASF